MIAGRLFTIILFTAITSFGNMQESPQYISHYLFPEFTPGKILLKNGTFKESLLNYNSVTEEMIFDQNGKKLALVGVESIDTIYIKDKKFITDGKVFYELADELPVPLLLLHRCSLIQPGKPTGYGGTSETSAITVTSSIYMSRGIYELKLPEDYKVQPYIEFVIKKNNEFNKVFNINQVIRCFPDKKDAIREYAKKQRTDFGNTEDVKNLIEFCNNN